jgi:hypothetical protein
VLEFKSLLEGVKMFYIFGLKYVDNFYVERCWPGITFNHSSLRSVQLQLNLRGEMFETYNRYDLKNQAEIKT